MQMDRRMDARGGAVAATHCRVRAAAAYGVLLLPLLLLHAAPRHVRLRHLQRAGIHVLLFGVRS
jgi:hypothetical protein